MTKNSTKIIAEPGKQEVIIIREFDAPRELLFKAHVDPKLYVQWVGPRGLTMRVDKFEPRSGGMWRYMNKEPGGSEFWFHGVNHEVLEPERLISTFEYEGLPEKGHVALQTTKFEALPGGRSRVTTQALFQSQADRDGMMLSGMERGVNEGYERLDELLSTQRQLATPQA